MMDDLDNFEHFVVDALYDVPQSYYATVYKNVESFRGALAGRYGKFVDDDFERYGERVFCYEFYHQLKILIEKERRTNPDFLHHAELQGEVEKMQIIELVERLHLIELTKEYAPDFLMHSPGTSLKHAFVIEVKCVSTLSANALLIDLQKINEFIYRYKYQRGLFITVNTTPDYIFDLIESRSDEIRDLQEKDFIKVICKADQKSKHKIFQL